MGHTTKKERYHTVVKQRNRYYISVPRIVIMIVNYGFGFFNLSLRSRVTLYSKRKLLYWIPCQFRR